MTDTRKEVISKLKGNIEIESTDVTSNTTYWIVKGTINNKSFTISRWNSYEDNIGSTDNGSEFLEDESDDLTDEEIEEVKEYCEENAKW